MQVSIFPSTVTACPGRNVTFTCRTTGGALLWEADNLQVVIDDATDMPGSLGIFSFSVLGVLKQGAMVVEVNSTATTLVGVRPSDNNVTLGCREASEFKAEKAVLRVSGEDYATCILTFNVLISCTVCLQQIS